MHHLYVAFLSTQLFLPGSPHSDSSSAVTSSQRPSLTSLSEVAPSRCHLGHCFSSVIASLLCELIPFVCSLAHPPLKQEVLPDRGQGCLVLGWVPDGRWCLAHNRRLISAYGQLRRPKGACSILLSRSCFLFFPTAPPPLISRACLHSPCLPA